MKVTIRSALGLLLALTLSSAIPTASVSPLLIDQAEAAVSVRGYTRKDGTYVRPHMRSNPDGNPYNNWSFPGNTNPYTGKTATGNPDTYLRNYYNRGSSTYSPTFTTPSYSNYSYPDTTSSYTLPTFTTPSFPSYSLPASVSTYHSCVEFGIGAQYSYLSERCECGYGYTARNNRCISDDDACEEDYGYHARSTFSGKCECGYGYRFNTAGTKCVSDEDYCADLDFNAEYNILTDSCVCKDGYTPSASKSSCIREYSDTPLYIPQTTCGSNAYEYNGSCYCNVGYVTNATGQCVYSVSAATFERCERGTCYCPAGQRARANAYGCELPTPSLRAANAAECDERFGPYSRFDILTGECGCMFNYVMKKGRCVRDRR